MMQNEIIDGLTVQSDRRWALIGFGIVSAVIFWDGDVETYDPSPLIPVELDADDFVDPGWTFDGVDFSPPIETDVSE